MTVIVNAGIKYNEYSMDHIKELVCIGQEMKKKYADYDEMQASEFDNYHFTEWYFIDMGWEFQNYCPGEIKTFYRIGEPRINQELGCYRCSFNYADDRPEMGVSVIDSEWLNGLSCRYFDIRRGVYSIPGFKIPYRGGDGETLIRPMGWAKKTRIRTWEGIQKRLKKCS